MEKITAVVVNYFSEAHTIDCVNSLFGSRYDGDIKVIIVDNGSSIDLTNYYDKTSSVEVIKTNTNIGFGNAVNVGLEAALRDVITAFILILNNDALVHESALLGLIKPFALDMRLGMTTGQIVYTSDRDRIWYGGGELDLVKGKPKIVGFNSTRNDCGSASESRYVTFASGCVMMFSRKTIEELQGFDSDFFMYYEDFEMCLRLKSRGYKIFYCADSLFFHSVQGSSKEKSDAKGLNPRNPNIEFYFRLFMENQYLANVKHRGQIRFRLFVIYYLVYWSYKLLQVYLFSGRLLLRDYLRILGRNIMYYEKD